MIEYQTTDDGRLICPCCGTAQLQGDVIAYCDACNTDTCGHWIERVE